VIEFGTLQREYEQAFYPSDPKWRIEANADALACRVQSG
jgi:hypothetical protein